MKQFPFKKIFRIICLPVRIINKLRRDIFYAFKYKDIKKYLEEVLKDRTADTKILVVVPSDPIIAYYKKGIETVVEGYYNPNKLFDIVFCLSPLEKGISYKYGMHIIGINNIAYRKCLKIIKPNAVRAYGGYWPTTFIVKNRVKNIPLITSVHDRRKSFCHKEISKVDYAFCVTDTVKQVVLEKGLEESKIRILHDRVDTEKFRKIVTDETSKKEENSYSVLYIGRLSYEKNPDTFIKAFSFLPKNYTALMFGAGNKKFENIIKKYNLSSRIKHFDRVLNEDLPKYYSSCSCFCLPSRDEGFGIVFIEAAACETPIVTSNISPMNKYLTHNESAYFVDNYESPQELAKAIQYVCEHKEYAENLGKNARLVAEKFDKKYVDNLEAELYKNIIDENMDTHKKNLANID